MGTKEAESADGNAKNKNNNSSNTTTTIISSKRNSSGNTISSCSNDAEEQKQQNEDDQQQYAQLPKASPPPQVIIIPTMPNTAKKIRRAFTMPRNPFRWSRKFKTTTTTGAADGADDDDECGGNPGGNSVGGGVGRAGSIVSLKAISSKDINGIVSSGRPDDYGGQPTNSPQQPGDGTAHNNANETKNDKIERKIGGKQNRNSSGVNASNNSAAAAAAQHTNSTNNRIFRRSSFRKFLNRIAQHVSNTVNIGAKKQTISLQHNNVISNTDRVPPIGGYQWPPDQTPGVMGLKNHGNTCFMNAVLQCLSHTDILAEYFVLDQYKADLKRRNKINSRKFGTKGELTEQLANVLKALWTCKNESDHSTSFKAVVDRYGSQFRSSTQHDAQEFLFWLLDKVHEDLNTATKRKYKSVKNSYGRPDEIIAAETLANHIRCNNSFVQAVFQAQFRSSLTCPRCKKQSNTFDPFHCISVQLPQLMQQSVFVTVVYLKQQPRQVKLGLRIPAGSPIVALREQLQTDTGISGDRMVLVDINKEGFSRVFYDTQPIESLIGIETIYCIEVPETTTDQSESKVNARSETMTFKTTVAPSKTATTPTTATQPNEISMTATTTTTITTATATVTATTTMPTTTATATNSAEKTNTAANTTISTIKPRTTGYSGANESAAELLLLVANVRKKPKANSSADEEKIDTKEIGSNLERFGTPFSMRAPRDCSFVELQKKLLQEMSETLKPEVFAYKTPLTDMFQIRLQCPSADPDAYLEQVEHPLLTEMIDMALSVLSVESGPAHVKLLLEWPEPEQYFADLSDTCVEHESFIHLRDNKQPETQALLLEQCLEHYTKAETLSAEDAWRCPHCQQYLPVVKTLGLWSLPDILVVHFKRFRQHQEKGSNAAKLTTMVKFPLTAFDMSPHLARGAAEQNSINLSAAGTFENYRPSPWRKSRPGDSRSSTLNSRDNKETRYDLYAVCYHQGDTLETGHYTAACKNPYDQQWYKFDDQRVSKVPTDSIQEEIINNEAYMLFYQRRNDNGECSGSSSNSGGDHWVSRLPPPPGATPLPVVEKFTATAESTIAPQAEESKILEEPKISSAEVKAVDTPTVEEPTKEHATADLPSPPVAAKTIIVQLDIHKEVDDTKTITKPTAMDIEKFDFADADDQQLDHTETPLTADADELPSEKSLLTISLNKEAPTSNANKAQSPQSSFNLNTEIIETIKPINEHVNPIKVNVITNGYKQKTQPEQTINERVSPGPTKIQISDNNSNRISNNNNNKKPNGPTSAPPPSSSPSSSSSSSSSSSLSSRSSPHELATSINGATTLQTKFNGYSSTTYASTIASHKEAFLSSSLKSNSSSIIGAHAATVSHNQEFHLSRYQHENWNGSRFSVSAVENAIAAQAHTNSHGLNLRHSFSTSSNYKLRECNETLSSLLRNSTNTCSKDTLLIIDQQTHHHHHHHNHPNSLLEDEDDNFMGSRSLWISPVTPHKLITVSPKN